MDISNTILIIDQDEAMHLVIQASLDKFNVSGKIKSAFSPQEAMEYLLKNAYEDNFPRLISLSIPDKATEGIELIKAIKSLKGFNPKKTQIFVLLSEADQSIRKEIESLEVDKVLPRPQLPEGFGRLRS